MIYKLTKQTRGKRTGYWSHPVTLHLGDNLDKMLQEAFDLFQKDSETKYSVWRLNETSGAWERVGSYVKL